MAEDDDDDYENTLFPDIPVDTTTMPKQDVIDDDGKRVDRLDHIIDSYINIEV